MKIFSFALPLAVGGLAAWLTMGSMSQYAALVDVYKRQHSHFAGVYRLLPDSLQQRTAHDGD